MPQLNFGDCTTAINTTLQWAQHAVSPAELDDPHFVALGLYKALVAYHATGRTSAAIDLMSALERGVSSTGDFHPGAQLTFGQALTNHGAHRGSNLYVAAFNSALDLARNYRNAWFAWGAHLSGATQVANAGLDGLEKTMHPRLGAVPNSSAAWAQQPVYALGTNASCANAFLASGRIDAAVRVGEFMRGLIMAQPDDASLLSLACNGSGQPLRPQEVVQGIAHKLYFLHPGQLGQVYWPLGFTIKVLAQLYRETGQSAWLDPAQRIAQWLKRCTDESTSSISSAKIGLGAGAMFAATGDRIWSDMAVRALQTIVRTQTPQGIWMRPDFPAWLPQPLLVSVDTSIERMYYLTQVPAALREGGAPLPE